MLVFACVGQSSPFELISKKDGATHAEFFSQAIKANIRPQLQDKLSRIVAAIRYAENGRKGREYGVLHPKALNKSYRIQAGWCAATVQKNYDRWIKAESKLDFITFLGKRYCPVEAHKLNKHWVKNVKYYFSSSSGPVISPSLVNPAPHDLGLGLDLDLDLDLDLGVSSGIGSGVGLGVGLDFPFNLGSLGFISSNTNCVKIRVICS